MPSPPVLGEQQCGRREKPNRSIHLRQRARLPWPRFADWRENPAIFCGYRKFGILVDGGDYPIYGLGKPRIRVGYLNADHLTNRPPPLHCRTGWTPPGLTSASISDSWRIKFRAGCRHSSSVQSADSPSVAKHACFSIKKSAAIPKPTGETGVLACMDL